jgi:hypothetical protein
MGAVISRPVAASHSRHRAVPAQLRRGLVPAERGAPDAHLLVAHGDGHLAPVAASHSRTVPSRPSSGRGLVPADRGAHDAQAAPTPPSWRMGEPARVRWRVPQAHRAVPAPAQDAARPAERGAPRPRQRSSRGSHGGGHLAGAAGVPQPHTRRPRPSSGRGLVPAERGAPDSHLLVAHGDGHLAPVRRPTAAHRRPAQLRTRPSSGLNAGPESRQRPSRGAWGRSSRGPVAASTAVTAPSLPSSGRGLVPAERGALTPPIAPTTPPLLVAHGGGHLAAGARPQPHRAVPAPAQDAALVPLIRGAPDAPSWRMGEQAAAGTAGLANASMVARSWPYIRAAAGPSRQGELYASR